MNVKEMIGGCIVCGEEQISDENSLIYCDGPCGHGFHQACYGVVEIPSGDWICRLCEFSVSQPKCELCPSTFGGFKPTGNKKWAHVICGLFLPEITFGDKTLMEPIILDGIHPEIFKKPCILCKTASDASYGACVTCSHPSCKTSFHVTCGQAEGLLVEETVKSKNDPSDPGTTYFVAYCSSHLHKQEHVAKNRANSSNMTYSYRIMPKIKLKDQLAHKSSSLNLSSSSSTTSSAPPSPASTKKKSSSSRSATSSKADREPKSSSKDSRNNTKSVSKKSASALDSSSSFSPFTNGSTASLPGNLPLSFSSEHSAYKSSSHKLESLHRKSNKHKLENDSPSAKHSISTSKLSKMDNTLSPFDISAKHRIVSPSTSSVNQPPRKRHHSDSTSSSDKSSSDDSSDNSDSDSSSSSSSSSSSNRSRVSHRSRKSNSSRSSSDDSRPNSSCSSHSEEEVEKSKVKKAFKKPQQIIAETIRDSMVFPKTTAATSKKAKQPNDSAISSSNNTSNESLHSSSIDKSSSNGRTKSDIFSDKGKASKSAKQSRTNVPSSKKDLSHNSSASSLGYTSSTKPPASSDSKSMSVLKSDGSDDETSEYSKRSKKSQKSSKPKKSANASSSVNSNRSSKKITSNKYVISGSSDESSDEKCPTDASDDEKSKYKSEDDSDNDFEFKKKSAKMTFNKKSTTEKKPKAVARSRTTSSSSSRKKSVSDESKPIIIPSGRRSPVKKELPQQTTASIKGKPLAKDAFTDPPVPASARARRTSASRSPAKSKMKISAPQTADLKPDVENMETDAVFVGESDSNTMSSPLRPHRGALKAAPPFVVNHHDSRVMSPSVNDDSTMSSVLSPPHSYRSSFMSPSGRSAMEHSGLNIHIPVKTGATTKEPPVASQRISPRIAALNEARPPPQMANLFVPRTIEELIEFQTVNTTNFLLSREENRDIAALMRQLNSLIQENSQTERSIESLSKELNCLMTLNKELKGVEITSSTSIISKRSQADELTLNGVNGEALGRSRALTATSGIGSLVTTPSLSSSELDSQSSCSMPTSHPTTFTSILNSKPSATPTLISSLNSVTPLAPTTTTASSMIYSSSSHQPLSTTTLQNANTSMANILAANNHFSQHGQQAPYNQPFVLNSNHATNASTSRSRQGEINLSASLSASLYASAGVHHQPPQQVTPLGSHLHGQVPGGHPLDNLTNPAILNQLNHLVTTGQVPTGALRHSASYQQLIGASAQYEQHQQQHSASNGSNINGRHAPLTRRNSGNSAAALNHHHSMANGVGTGTSSTSASNRPYENSLGHASTNGGPNSAHFYNHN